MRERSGGIPAASKSPLGVPHFSLPLREVGVSRAPENKGAVQKETHGEVQTEVGSEAHEGSAAEKPQPQAQLVPTVDKSTTGIDMDKELADVVRRRGQKRSLKPFLDKDEGGESESFTKSFLQRHGFVPKEINEEEFLERENQSALTAGSDG